MAGGSGEQRAAVTEELRRFEGWVGTERMGLTEVRFVELAHNEAARYVVGRKRVELSPTRGVTQLRRDLRHELCHALDHQDPLTDHPVPVLEDVAPDVASYLRDSVVQGASSWDPNDPDDVRAETLGLLCETGPVGVQLWVDTHCGVEDRGPLGTWMLRSVWREYAPLPVVVPPRTERTVVAADLVDEGWLVIRDSRTPGLVEVDLGDDEWIIEVETGLPREESVTLAAREPRESRPAGLDTRSAAATGDGRTLAAVAADVPFLVEAPRWMSFEPEVAWQLHDDCPSGLPAAFAHDGALWAAELVEPEMSWQTVPAP